MRIVFFIFSLIPAVFSSGQDSAGKKAFSYDLYLETYYSYDFSRPADHEKPEFIYNHKRHHEFNMNLALVRGSWQTEKARAGLGFMAGTYPEYNLASEPEMLKHIYEAFVGIRISKKSKLWLDAGIFPSHIGFESAIGKDCWTLTRSILAENSPYYESGIRSVWKPGNEHWMVSLLLLNGWQRIKRPEGYHTVAAGWQIAYGKTDQFNLNYSGFIGSDKPDSLGSYRYFNNVYALVALSGRWKMILGFDVGVEKERQTVRKVSLWYSPVIILRYQSGTAWRAAIRGEYYSDREGVIIPPAGSNAFETLGISANLDLAIGRQVLWRMEGRWLHNRNPYYQRNTSLSRSNSSLTTSLSIGLSGK